MQAKCLVVVVVVNRSTMCTSLFFYDIHPTILFLLAFNREEYYERYETSVHANERRMHADNCA